MYIYNMEQTFSLFDIFDNLENGETYRIPVTELREHGLAPGHFKQFAEAYNEQFRMDTGLRMEAIKWSQEIPRDISGGPAVNNMLAVKQIDWYRGMFDRFDEFVDEAITRNAVFIVRSHENGELLAKYARKRDDIASVRYDGTSISFIVKRFGDTLIEDIRNTVRSYSQPEAFLIDSDEYVVRVTVSRECKRYNERISVSFSKYKDYHWVILHKNEVEGQLFAYLLGMGLTKPDARNMIETIKSKAL